VTSEAPELMAVPAGPAPAGTGPWPFFASLGWMAALTGLMAVVQVVAVMVPAIAEAFQAVLHGKGVASGGGFRITGATLFWAQLACAAAVLPVAWWLAALRRTGDTLGYLGLRRHSWKPLVLGAIGVGVVGGIASLLVDDVNPAMKDLFDTARPKPLLWISVVVLAPLVEEFVFRGFVFEGLSQVRGGIWTASLISSALWASIHLQYGPNEMAVIFLLGLVLGGVRGHSGSVWPGMILHAANNLVSTVWFEVAAQSGNS